MDSACAEAGSMLQSPSLDLACLQQSLRAQAEHVVQLHAVSREAAEKLSARRREKEGLLALICASK
jgi:hypothetical protein